MEPLQISLSPELAAFVEQQVIGGGYQDPSDYVSWLIQSKQLEQAGEDLEDMLEAGLNSPSRKVTPEYWEDLKARIAAKVNAETAS